MTMMKMLLVAGARANFRKIAPVYRPSKNHPGVDCRIVHTGQHPTSRALWVESFAIDI
jgi:UDP-N-acetylglucosamine 2-epimerase